MESHMMLASPTLIHACDVGVVYLNPRKLTFTLTRPKTMGYLAFPDCQL
jgi:hypothetical protein